MTSDGEADVTSQRVMVKSDWEVDLPIERFAMLPGMDDLDLAVAHLHNTIEHCLPSHRRRFAMHFFTSSAHAVCLSAAICPRWHRCLRSSWELSCAHAERPVA